MPSQGEERVRVGVGGDWEKMGDVFNMPRSRFFPLRDGLRRT